jgi:ketosteroid isomerase-like protein
MGESNVDLVRAAFERFDFDDPEPVLELLSEDFVSEIPSSMSAEPDVYVGHEGVRRYLRAFDGLLEDVRFEPLEMLEEGGRVIVVLRLIGRGVSSGIEVAQESAVVNWVENGKITRMQPFPDLEAAREAMHELG